MYTATDSARLAASCPTTCSESSAYSSWGVGRSASTSSGAGSASATYGSPARLAWRPCGSGSIGTSASGGTESPRSRIMASAHTEMHSSQM